MLSCCSDGMAGKKKTKGCIHKSCCRELLIQPDDSVRSILGDTVSDIIFNHDDITLLRLSPILQEDTLHKDSVIVDSVSYLKLNEDYYITKDFGKLCTSQISPLLFLMSDQQFFFVCDEKLLKTPFEGETALRFHKNKKTVVVVFSFTGGQLKIYANKAEQQIKYTQERYVLKYFQQFLKDETLQKILDSNLIR